MAVAAIFSISVHPFHFLSREHRARRQRLLAGISDRQKKRTKDKAAQMSERRLEAEEVICMLSVFVIE